MQEYWIETAYFATSIGNFTPKQYDAFGKLCQGKSKTNDEAVPILVHDYTQDWEEMKFNPGRDADDFWEKVKYHDVLVEDQSPGTTFVKIFPKDTIKEQPSSFVKKRIRYEKIVEGTASIQKYAKADRNLLKDFLDLAEYVRGNYAEQSTHSEPLPVPPEKENATDSEATQSTKLPKKPENKPPKSGEPRKLRQKKYEVAVESHLNELVASVREGDLSQATVLNRTPLEVAEFLKTKDQFKNAKVESIVYHVRHSDAWKNRQNILKQLDGVQPPSLHEAYGDQAYDEDTKRPNVSVVDVSRDEYEAPVEECLRAIRNRILLGEITPEVYCQKVSGLTPKVVAIWIRKEKPAFKGRSHATIENGVEDSVTWKNREEILNVTEYT